MAGDEAYFDFSRIDSRDISSKKEFLSEDAINVSTNGENATQCCNPVNPAPKQSKSPKAQDDVGLSESTVLVWTASCQLLRLNSPNSSAISKA